VHGRLSSEGRGHRPGTFLWGAVVLAVLVAAPAGALSTRVLPSPSEPIGSHPEVVPTAAAPLRVPGVRPTQGAAGGVGRELPWGIRTAAPTGPHGLLGASLPSGVLTAVERARIPVVGPTSLVLPPGRAAGGPPNLVLSNNSTMLVSTDTVVGDITLSDNATLYVHSPTIRPTLTVLGNIVLSGRSTLFVNGSDLAIGESYDVEWNIQVTGTARFVTNDSNVTTNGYQWGAAFEDSANVTILSSFVGYPTGWLDTDLVGSPTMVVAYSWYSSDVILFDNALAPSTANFTAGFSIGFNIWLNFKSGTTANLTLPGAEGWRNWTYPGGAPESGIGYTVTVIDSFVLLFAVMLWQGADLTLSNSPDVVVALNLEYGPVVLQGLEQAHYTSFSIATGGLALRLQNTTVFTWNVYPFDGAVSISSSQIGEIQVFGDASANVTSSNLTGEGGYYGNQGTQFLSIASSTIASQVVSYSGRVDLVNSTVNTSFASRVLATGNGTVDCLNTALGPLDTFQVLGQGAIDRSGTVDVAVAEAGVPEAGVAVVVEYDSNGTQVPTGSTDSGGAWSGPITGWTLGIGGLAEWNYTVRGVAAASVGLTDLLDPTMPVSVDLGLQPVVEDSTPATGASAVSQNLSAVVIAFTFPMVAAPTQSAVSATPLIGWTALWDADDQNLSLLPTSPLLANTTYTLTVGTGVLTQDGLSPDVVTSISFSTAAVVRPVPTVVGTTPMNGTDQVSLDPQILISFSVAMNLTLAEGSFTITPGGPAGTFSSPSASVLGWLPTGSLENNTTYTVAVGVSAQSTLGVALAHPFSFEFRTLAIASTSPIQPVSGGGPSAPSTDWLLYGGLGLVALAIVAGLAVLAWRRRREPPIPPTAGAPTAATPTPAVPAPWSEDLTDPSSPDGSQR
jgi:hypothetical protein